MRIRLPPCLPHWVGEEDTVKVKVLRKKLQRGLRIAEMDVMRVEEWDRNRRLSLEVEQ